MKEPQSSDDRGRSTDRSESAVGRRTFIAAGGTASAALFAGCISDRSPADGDGEETDESTDDGDGANFRLLISDLPADIGDFDRLDVSFDNARIFDGGGEESDEKEEEEAEKEEEAEEAEKEEEADEDGVERKRGFYILDLDDATVDITKVVGDKAMNVFDGELSAGSYQKIELHVSDVEGIVDGEAVDVKVPSEKLQITKPFEIAADESIDFVFDINVVKRGPNNGYILKPVISESGVNGKDVDVEEVDDDDETEDDDDESEDDDDETDEPENESDDSEDDDEAGTGEDGDDKEDDTTGDEADGTDNSEDTA